ncbi:CCA tRNA nucleotidyltransferase [Pseudomonadota bacterium]
MNKSKEIEETVLEKITPSPLDRSKLNTIIARISEKVQHELAQRDLNATIELVGSTAKDTYLRGDLDIDLFLVYPPKTLREDMATQTISIGRNLLSKTEECYAEHPYIRGYFKSYLVELVPCYQLSNAREKQSAVDRTPLHTEYILQHIDEDHKQEIRLFKQFLKGIGCYGAEAEVQGFSGYLCELLILYYKTFHNLISQAQTWKKGLVIALNMDNPPSFPEPLTVIDPVDHERNVASAVVLETFNRFIRANKAYIERPSVNFFFPKPVIPWSISRMRKSLSTQSFQYLGVVFPKPSLIPETLIPQIRKTCRSIKKECKSYGFKVHDVRYEIVFNKNLIYIIIKTDPNPLPPTYIHTGPPIKLHKNTEEFNKKWRNNPEVITEPFEKDGRTYVELKRSYQHIDAFLKEKLTTFSLGKNLDGIINTAYEIVDLESLLKKELAVFWTRYLDRKKSWER